MDLQPKVRAPKCLAKVDSPSSRPAPRSGQRPPWRAGAPATGGRAGFRCAPPWRQRPRSRGFPGAAFPENRFETRRLRVPTGPAQRTARTHPGNQERRPASVNGPFRCIPSGSPAGHHPRTVVVGPGMSQRAQTRPCILDRPFSTCAPSSGTSSPGAVGAPPLGAGTVLLGDGASFGLSPLAGCWSNVLPRNVLPTPSKRRPFQGRRRRVVLKPHERKSAVSQTRTARETGLFLGPTIVGERDGPPDSGRLLCQRGPPSGRLSTLGPFWDCPGRRPQTETGRSASWKRGR
ncbi:hypothetical protein M885DRAFT_467 [Pelagophyceae sp. CCMP2097]|nr:hypothetical protein M885DRAFT_467 [Pelagophyceae sp. CCMP2097]